MKKQTDKTEMPKSASITLRANGATLSLLAVRKPDGTAVTYVTTRAADKTLSKGMTNQHATMELAKAELAAQANAAVKLGWKRGVRTAPSKPDAFSKMPTPPKAA